MRRFFWIDLVFSVIDRAYTAFHKAFKRQKNMDRGFKALKRAAQREQIRLPSNFAEVDHCVIWRNPTSSYDARVMGLRQAIRKAVGLRQV